MQNQQNGCFNMNKKRFICIHLEDNHAPDLQGRGHLLVHVSERKEMCQIVSHI